MPLLRLTLLLASLASLVSPLFAAANWVSPQPAPGAFPLVSPAGAAALVISAADAKVVTLAATDLAADLARVTGQSPALLTTPTAASASADPTALPAGPLVLIGTLGSTPLIDHLVATGQLNLPHLAGAWESFVITTVAHPFPQVPSALVIVGSDRRGTAYGIYELSEAIGVSPWHWWADVTPAPQDALYLAADTRRVGPPAVKFRGIFLNDEDWGLQPWAAQTFEPETGDIGPKTYAKVFELLLRLRANTLWPAMHACTRPFNADPRNAALADDYAIVMGSSHAEPMLRNNVGEWTAPKPDYNYVAHRDGVLAYWDERVRTNGGFENLYTLGMRGIHDSAIQGTTSDAQRIEVLEQVFADQRALLAAHVSPAVESVPQIFCAYKEVLDLYRQGLRVPDDVTLVWPDDNFGYVRNFASPAERTRAGGFGIYYHISYLGRPLAYLWLSTTPPALIWTEMTKSFHRGADRVWIVNVGDLKPAEIGTEFFLRLAWEPAAFGPDAQTAFLRDWSARTFGPDHAPAIADVLNRFYILNSVRRPEHLQWWTPLKEEPHASPFTAAAAATRLAAFDSLVTTVNTLAPQLPDRLQDAFFELVAYPVRGAALANHRYFAGESGDAPAATAADTALHDLTAQFDALADGKWRGFMRLEPADDDWRSMRIAPWTPPTFRRLPESPPPLASVTVHAANFTAAPADPSGARWQPIAGLGHTGQALTVVPHSADHPSAPSVTYTVDLPTSGPWTLSIDRLPTHPVDATAHDTLDLQIDAGPWQTVDVSFPDGSPTWSQAVLNNRVTTTVPLPPLNAGPHTVRFRTASTIVLDQFRLQPDSP